MKRTERVVKDRLTIFVTCMNHFEIDRNIVLSHFFLATHIHFQHSRLSETSPSKKEIAR